MMDPKTYTNSVQVLALCKFAGVGPRLFEALFSRYGTLNALLGASKASLMSIDGMTDQRADKITSASERLVEAEQFEAVLRGREIGICTRFDHDYHPLLYELNDPPTLLYVRGRMPEPRRKSVTILGAEDATAEGLQLTSTLAKAFASAGVQVISSLTGAADASAHLACKAANGDSYAILEHGFDHLEQREQVPLAIDIAHTGGVISEYAPDAARSEVGLAESNRLIVGLSHAVVVTKLFHNSERAFDALNFCNQIGKLAFIVNDSKGGVVADDVVMARALAHGAIPFDGTTNVNDIIRSLV
jgi:DNA processing protein